MSQSASPEGPFLSFAVLCERSLEEKDSVLSLIRLVDRFQVVVHAVAPSGVSGELVMPSPLLPLTVAIGFRSAGFKGTKQLTLQIDTPSGFKLPELKMTLTFEGDERGVNLILPTQFPAQDDGLYWFVVRLDDDVVTKIPLRITKQLVSQTIPPQL